MEMRPHQELNKGTYSKPMARASVGSTALACYEKTVEQECRRRCLNTRGTAFRIVFLAHSLRHNAMNDYRERPNVDTQEVVDRIRK